MPPREVLPKAKEAAFKAVEIDDDLAEAHASLGLVRVYYDHDWAAAESEFKKCLVLNPDFVPAHQRYGSYLAFIGRFEQSLKHYRHALELDPFSLQINMNIATDYYLMGENDAAAYIQQGELVKAIEEFQYIYKMDEESYMALGFMGYAHALAGQTNEARTSLIS